MKISTYFLFFCFALKCAKAVDGLYIDRMTDLGPPSEKEKEISKKLHDGDFSPLDEAFKNKDAIMLWWVFLRSVSSDASNEIKTAHEKARELLAQIPGHTERQIQFIEDKAELAKQYKLLPNGRGEWEAPDEGFATIEEKEAWDKRLPIYAVKIDRQFNELAELGTPECVQTLMTYIGDERRNAYEMNMYPSRGGKRWYPSPPFWRNATECLGRLLGDKSPDPPGKYYTAPPEYSSDQAIRQRYYDWWASDASLPWRKTIVPTSRSHLLPVAGRPAPVPTNAVEPQATSGHSYWSTLLIILCAACVLILITWFSAQRVRR